MVEGLQGGGGGDEDDEAGARGGIEDEDFMANPGELPSPIPNFGFISLSLLVTDELGENVEP